MLTVGRIDPNIVAIAETKRFDQLPVLDPSGTLLGLIGLENVRDRLEGNLALTSSDPELHLSEIEENPPLLSLLAQLSSHRALVLRSNHHNSEAVTNDDWFALITISDLNRHVFRAYLYPILAKLEASLAELIDRRFADPWTWLPSLRPERQVQVIGRWELEKRNSVETSPITGAMLTDMLQVVSMGEELRRDLGFTSKSKFNEHAGSIPNLRNQIMHPVRPLVLCQKDVLKLHSTLEGIVSLTQGVYALNSRLAAQGMHSRRVLP